MNKKLLLALAVTASKSSWSSVLLMDPAKLREKSQFVRDIGNELSTLQTELIKENKKLREMVAKKTHEAEVALQQAGVVEENHPQYKAAQHKIKTETRTVEETVEACNIKYTDAQWSLSNKLNEYVREASKEVCDDLKADLVLQIDPQSPMVLAVGKNTKDITEIISNKIDEKAAKETPLKTYKASEIQKYIVASNDKKNNEVNINIEKEIDVKNSVRQYTLANNDTKTETVVADKNKTQELLTA